ncbi:MAG TPA: energy transducer TonB [Chitinophagaceae bacterium]|nr:energy transducer TonB [Chitinophagaceae bacterium]
METNSILSANILDILFEGRNKEYGAYDLRNTYNKRIGTALGITITVVMVCIGIVIGTKVTDSNATIPSVFEFETTPPPQDKIIIPEKQPIRSKPIKTLAFPPPIIVIDNLVTKPPVENKDLINAMAGLKNIDGENAKGIIAPVEIQVNNAIEAPVKKENLENVIADFVEIEAKFKGNWGAYVQKEIEKNIDELIDAGATGTCIVKFVVSKDGSVSNVEAITMKGTKLAEVAVNAIRKGPKWIPAIQNGMQVNAYRQQPVTFKINE